MTFTDRTEAGRRLAERLAGRIDGPAVVLALPRGGVPVAVEVAGALDAPLDVIGVRKIGAPWQPELGLGAVAEGDGVYLDEHSLGTFGLGREDLEEAIDTKRREVARSVARYRGDRPLPDLEDRTVIVVDDGLATGVTARAAVRAVRNRGAQRVVLAIPVCSATGRDDLAREVDDMVCVLAPEHFSAVGQWYDDFDQVSDDEVLAALARADKARAGSR
jgi:putative phosphoribosyl transferase